MYQGVKIHTSPSGGLVFNNQASNALTVHLYRNGKVCSGVITEILTFKILTLPQPALLFHCNAWRNGFQII